MHPINIEVNVYYKEQKKTNYNNLFSDTITHREKRNSVHKFLKVISCLLLIFSICLRNQLKFRKFHCIINVKVIHQADEK